MRLAHPRADVPYPSLIRYLGACAPARLTHHYHTSYAPTRFTCLRAFTLTNKCLSRLFFLLCCVVSIVRYDFRLKNPRKATGPDFIPLKVIKFASNVINSHLCNIIIKDLEKYKHSENKNSISKTHL